MAGLKESFDSDSFSFGGKKKQNTNNSVTIGITSAINKNKASLLRAIKDRLANDEDADAHDTVNDLIIKTAIEAGMNKQEAEDTPWMESYAIPDEMSAEESLEMLEAELNDRKDDGRDGGFF